MFRKEYKNDFNSVTPDINLINNTAQKFNNNPSNKYSGILKRFVAAVATICLLMGGMFITSNLNKPVFALVAFAADSGGQHVNIEENIKVTLPFGKISRGDRNFYPDETGKKVYIYDAGFEHGGISVRGDNISYVKYTSNVGELRFFDSVASKQIRQPEQDEKPKQKVVLHKIENGDFVIQKGKEVTTSFHEELGTKSFDVNWVPWYAIDIISKDGSINFADLPSDIITVEVHFTNGKSTTKQLQLSFNNNGSLIAEIVTE